jgi:hypothetical protein
MRAGAGNDGERWRAIQSERYHTVTGKTER